MIPESGSFHRPTCHNCDASMHGEYCHRCGQHDHDLDIRFSELTKEWLGSAFGLDARLWRTLRLLALRPGELTRRYLDGHRAAYVSPLRLYLVSSLLLFLVLSWTGSSIVVNGEGGGGGGSIVSINTTSSTGTGGDEAADDEAAGTTATNDPRSEPADTESEAPGAIERFFDRAGDHLTNDRTSFDTTFREQAGRVIILLVPAFALLLKLLFHSSRRPYVHHLVFSLHVHALTFVVVTCCTVIGSWLRPDVGESLAKLAYLGIMLYLGIALRRFFGNGRLMTALKTFVLLVSHLVVLLFVLVAA
ncbi:MAG: DUF3667 domain-containing protein, partial [Acidobacteriota bacterium]